MDPTRTSLRLLVDKWLAPTLATTPAHILRFGRTSRGVRYVSIEVLRQAGPLTIVFFQHRDRFWHVFPPSTDRPVMKVCLQAA